MKLAFTFTDVSMTEEEFQASQKKESTQFEPGIYDLKIMDAKFMKMSEKDDTWAQFRLILSQEGDKVVVGDKDGKEVIQVTDKKGRICKSIRTTILVPLQKETFGDPNGKNSGFVFAKLREFFLAIGETLLCSKESMKAIIPKYFKDPKALHGQILNCKIGYRGAYLNKDGDKVYIYDAKGERISEEGFDDFDSAKAYAATELEIGVSSFVEILKFNPTDPIEEKGAPIVVGEEKW